MDSETLVLHPSPRFGLLMVSLLFTLGGGAMVALGNGTGWLVLGFFVLCDLWILVNMLPSAACLRLTREGFESRSLHRTHSVRWTDITGFTAASLGEGIQRQVCFNYAPHFAGERVFRRLSAQTAGFEAGLSDTYGMSAEKLAELLNEWLERHTATAQVA